MSASDISAGVKKRKRRRFTPAYKAHILRAAEACTAPGELAALLEREGLYSSHLAKWRRQREAGNLNVPPAGDDNHRPSAYLRLAELERENGELRFRLAQAEGIVLDVQKMASEILRATLELNGRR